LATKIDLKPTTKRTYEGLVNNHVIPKWKRTRLVDITHADVAEWVVSLRNGGLSASSVRQTHRVFSLMLALAVRDGRIARNPADGVPLPRPAKGEQVFLTHDQVDQLADAAGGHRLTVLFLAYTGVRYGEMAALRVSRLDLLRRRARIIEAVADVNGRAIFGTTKTHQQRVVPIPKFLAKELEQHLVGKSPDDFVFAAEKGGVLHLRNFAATTSTLRSSRRSSRASRRIRCDTRRRAWQSQRVRT
jgi:integrase